MKQKMSAKKMRILWFTTGVIWLANAMLNGWWLFVHLESIVDTGQVVTRGLMILLSLVCATLNFVNWYLWKTKE